MAELVECARLEIVYTGDRIEGSNPPISAINLPAIFGGLIYGGIGRFRNISRTKFGGRVRKQVDFGSVNAPKSLRFPHRHESVEGTQVDFGSVNAPKSLRFPRRQELPRDPLRPHQKFNRQMPVYFLHAAVLWVANHMWRIFYI